MSLNKLGKKTVMINVSTLTFPFFLPDLLEAFNTVRRLYNYWIFNFWTPSRLFGARVSPLWAAARLALVGGLQSCCACPASRLLQREDYEH
jgi:hypothetical protein